MSLGPADWARTRSHQLAVKTPETGRKSGPQGQRNPLVLGPYGISFLMELHAHVRLSGDRAGDYVVTEERADGSLTLVPRYFMEGHQGALRRSGCHCGARLLFRFAMANDAPATRIPRLRRPPPSGRVERADRLRDRPLAIAPIAREPPQPRRLPGVEAGDEVDVGEPLSAVSYGCSAFGEQRLRLATLIGPGVSPSLSGLKRASKVACSQPSKHRAST